ncbi:MAG: hypothetical protein ABJ239_02970 [Erythrobacter sp.]
MNIIRSVVLTALAALLLTASPARAEWHQASSDNFVIYSDSKPKNLRRFAEMLEHYHVALGLLTGREVPKPSPSNRVTIYVVGSERTLRKLYGDKNSSVAGFYIPRAGGSRAFVPRVRVSTGEPDFSVTVLLHEYAHHFLISSSRHAMPRWFSEGAAEFFSSARMRKDALDIGRPAYHRGAELVYGDLVTVEQLMDPEKYKEAHGNNLASFYGRSWALYHYLYFSPERKGQLTDYWNTVASGSTPLEAAEQVFGDLEKLEKELLVYLNLRKISSYRIKKTILPIGPIDIVEMSPGMDEMLPIIIRSQRGVTEEEALELLPEAQEIAAEFPNDPGVLAALAEAEFDAGNTQQAIEAADRAIAIDPATKPAYIQKGFALFKLAEDAEDADAAFKAAMQPFTALNRLENDHPLPLIYFYRSYVQGGREPSETARHALERASELAPFDLSLAFNVGIMQASEGKIDLAASTLAPLAANPHGGGQADAAKFLIDQLNKSPEGEPFLPNFDEFEDALESSGDGTDDAATDGENEDGEEPDGVGADGVSADGEDAKGDTPDDPV